LNSEHLNRQLRLHSAFSDNNDPLVGAQPCEVWQQPTQLTEQKNPDEALQGEP
jgi:hypothetical protein